MSIQKRLRSFRYAAQGLADLFGAQPNARIHLVLAIVAVFLGWFLQISRWEWVVVTGCIALVLMAEAFNTALEYLADRVSPEYHPLIGKAKDVSAAGVLLAAVGALIMGAIVFLPRLVPYL